VGNAKFKINKRLIILLKKLKMQTNFKISRGINLLMLCLSICLISLPVSAKKNSDSQGGSHAVKGYFKKDGKYVQPHRATNPNQTQRDNWSSKPNVNPYNGKPGTKEAEK
jgi:hypothetical protein